MEPYFAYGINVYQPQIMERCPSTRFVSIAILNGYRFNIVLDSKRWKGGVSGIVPDPDARVEGILYEFTKDDLLQMDKYENVALGMYTRERVNVELPDGQISSAWVYLPCPDIMGDYPPSVPYMKKIVEGAKKHGLSRQYIHFLEFLLFNR